MRVWFPSRFFSCFFVVLLFFVEVPKSLTFGIWYRSSSRVLVVRFLVETPVEVSYLLSHHVWWNWCLAEWDSAVSVRLLFCSNFCWDILSPLSPRLVKLMSCRIGLCRIGSFAFCCNFCCCRNPKVLDSWDIISLVAWCPIGRPAFRPPLPLPWSHKAS